MGKVPFDGGKNSSPQAENTVSAAQIQLLLLCFCWGGSIMLNKLMVGGSLQSREGGIHG
jgi:hypothetical protein